MSTEPGTGTFVAEEPELTWTCMVCGDTRPDRQIQVYQASSLLKSGVEITTNVRYCSDRPSCFAGALRHPLLDFIKEKEANE
jgi:hypothetical protein